MQGFEYMEHELLISDHPAVIEESIQLTTQDGCKIQGTYFVRNGNGHHPCAVVFNCGAGIASRHYRHFAQFLASSGIPVLTYDYRGIGLSKPATLRKFQATIEDWAEYDCAAAIDWLSVRTKKTRVFGVGHSVGSILFCGAPNSSVLAGLVMIGAHTAYYGDYRQAYRLPMAVLWHGVMPVLTSIFGFFPAKLLRLGDDIPKGVAMQWARRRTPIFGPQSAGVHSERMRRLVGRLSKAEFDALILTITDDGFATKAGAARVREFLPLLHINHQLISPAQAGRKRLGHFGFFRREASETLWPIVLRHLKTQSELESVV
jgi:predicted alpha/beta hydrolase